MRNGAPTPVPEQSQAAPEQPDWRIVAQTAMQQRDRANSLAHNLEIDLIMARAKVEALERASGITAAAALARVDSESLPAQG